MATRDDGGGFSIMENIHEPFDGNALDPNEIVFNKLNEHGIINSTRLNNLTSY